MAGKFQVVQQAFELSVRIFLCTLPRCHVNTRGRKKMRVNLASLWHEFKRSQMHLAVEDIKRIVEIQLSSQKFCGMSMLIRSGYRKPSRLRLVTFFAPGVQNYVWRRNVTVHEKIAIFVSPAPPESCWEINAVEGSSCFEIRNLRDFLLVKVSNGIARISGTSWCISSCFAWGSNM